VNDFDKNGSPEPIFTYSDSQREYPIALRQDLLKQMSSLKKKFVYSRDYAGKNIREVVTEDLLERATRLHFYNPLSAVMFNEGNGDFRLERLPPEAQVAPVYGIDTGDYNGDGYRDIILGGNLYAVKPEIGRYDALMGVVLAGDGKGNFTPLQSAESGIRLSGEVRHIGKIRNRNGWMLTVVRNNDAVLFFKLVE